MTSGFSVRAGFIAAATAVLGACSQPQDNSAQQASGSSAATAAFRDCADCPEMVTIPAGEYMMGSPSSEQYRGAETQHPVTIASPFALSKYEVTFGQWTLA